MSDRSRASIGGSTRAVAVIGHPVRHSLSPRIHNAAFAAADLDWVYLALDVAPDQGPGVVEAMRTLDLAGVSVTMPHKAVVALAADDRTLAAERLGAANCLFWRDGRIVAHSTDGDGFVAAYEHRFNRSFAGQSVAVFGAGGAAKAIVEAVGRNKAESILVYNRSADRLAVAIDLADQARAGRLNELPNVEVIINASAVGMAGSPAADSALFDLALINEQHTVIDIVYNPQVTPLLAAATAHGARTQGGVAMLVHQAALAFEIWTGQPAPLDAMLAAVADSLG